MKNIVIPFVALSLFGTNLAIAGGNHHRGGNNGVTGVMGKISGFANGSASAGGSPGSVTSSTGSFSGFDATLRSVRALPEGTNGTGWNVAITLSDFSKGTNTNVPGQSNSWSSVVGNGGFNVTTRNLPVLGRHGW